MFQPSELATATKVFIQFIILIRDFCAGHKCKSFCIYIAEKKLNVTLRQNVHQIINSRPGLYFFLSSFFVSERGNSQFFSFLLTVFFMALNYLWFDKIINEVACHLIQFKFKHFVLIKNCFRQQTQTYKNLSIECCLECIYQYGNHDRIYSCKYNESLDYINVSFAMFSLPFKSLSWLFTRLLFIMLKEGKNVLGK